MPLHTIVASLLVAIALQSAVTKGRPTTPLRSNSCSRDSFTVVPNKGSGIWPYRQYRSSNATPPNFHITQSGEPLAPGFIFIDPQDAIAPGQEVNGTMIMTSDGDLIWNGPEVQSTNFRTATLNGEPVITFWRGSGDAAAGGQAGHGYGQVNIMDTSSKVIHEVCPKVNILQPPGSDSPCAADVHESYITPNNTIVVTMYNTTMADLTSVGGPQEGWVLNPLAVEVDIESNEAVFIWDPLDHIPLNATNYPLLGAGLNSSNPFDWFHMNAIQPYNGNFLVNSRHTWESYYVNRDGDVLWTINGVNGGDFGPLPPGAQFSWQHDSRIKKYSDTQSLLTYFANNNDAPEISNPTPGLGLIIENTPNKTLPPQLYSSVVDDDDYVFSYAEGAYQLLDNGNALLGYGVRPVMKEFGPLESGTAKARWTAEFGYNNNNNNTA